MDARLKTPFRLLLVGPSGSGKTSWVMKLLHWRETMFERQPAYVVYYYNVWQNIYSQMANVVDDFRQGIPSTEEIESLSAYKGRGGSLVVIDDQLKNITGELAAIFQVAGRHSGVSLLFLSQSLFPKDPNFREISLQSTYIVLMKNPRDGASINHLARQVSPSNYHFIINSYADATLKNAYSYFLIDLNQETDEHLRYRTNIFPQEEPHIAYVTRAEKVSGPKSRPGPGPGPRRDHL